MTFSIKTEGKSYKHFEGPHKVVATEVIINFSSLQPQICYQTKSMAGIRRRLFLTVKDMRAATRKKKKLILVMKLKENQS